MFEKHLWKSDILSKDAGHQIVIAEQSYGSSAT